MSEIGGKPLIIQLDLDRYEIEKHYRRNEKVCVFDPLRKILLIETPEEVVRQKLILFLQEEIGVPASCIQTEVPMIRFKKRARGRADIIVYGQDQDENVMRPVLVVECKAPDVPLTDNVVQQVMHYNDILGADTIMITNGSESLWWSWNEEKQGYISLEEIPTYNSLISQQGLVFDESALEQLLWPRYEDFYSEDLAQEFIDEGILGEETPKEMQPFIINLASFFLNEQDRLEPQTLSGIKIIEDGGLRYASYGNVAGGEWPGVYRCFIIEDEENNNQIISISVLACGKFENDPKFNNRRGFTSLIVAIDDYDRSHNSLQLNIDDYTSADGNQYTIWHDGKLTVGNKGSAKRSEVIEYISIHQPDLLDVDGRVLLGTLDHSRELSFSQHETREFIGRLIKYAIIRDRFRKFAKQKKSKAVENKSSDITENGNLSRTGCLSYLVTLVVVVAFFCKFAMSDPDDFFMSLPLLITFCNLSGILKINIE